MATKKKKRLRRPPPVERPYEPDGRRARSLRTRAIIVESFLQLIRDTHTVPTAKQIAKAAGCSARSVFERFSDFRELAAASFDQVLQQGLSTPVGEHATRDRRSRIAFHVKIRATNCEKWLPLWRVLTRNEIGNADIFALRMGVVREMSRARLKLMYEPELATLSAWKNQATLIALEALTDYEAWGRLREHYKLSFAQGCEVWEAMTDQLLPATPA